MYVCMYVCMYMYVWGGREGGISINDIPDRDGHVHTYVHHENRSLIQSLALMRSAIIKVHVCTSGMCEWYTQMCMSVCTCTCTHH